MSIEVKNLSHTYLPGTPLARQALQDVSLTIASGSFTAIAGHTGSGKSTFIQHLNGLLQPTAGKVLVDGVDISGKDMPARQARQRVGMVFQYPEQQLFEESVAADVAFGPKNQGLSEEEVAKRVREAMALVGLSYEAYGETSPFQLSGGEKRRVAIAGVLAMHPDYLVLDEPTAGLDPRGREALMQMIVGLAPMTIIFVSHNMDDILRLADKLLVFSQGKLVLEGTPTDVFKERTILAQAGLKPPELTLMMEELHEAGLAADSGARNLSEAAESIRQVCQKRTNVLK